MSSFIYYRFKSNTTTENIPIEGSVLSVRDLKSAICLKSGLKSNNFCLICNIADGKDLDDTFLIPALSNVIVRRMPLLNSKPIAKTINPENFNKSDTYQLMRKSDNGLASKIINMATSDMTEDEKQDHVAQLASKVYMNSKRVPTGPIPSKYLCNKCNIAGHWINDCPGIPDKNGNMLDSKKVKRPSGIPATHLREVDSDTPNSYLTTDGRYVVNTRNFDAYQKGKKDKKPFSKEENPQMIMSVDERPESLLCGICKDFLSDPVDTPCCDKAFCRRCALNCVFGGEEVFHKCPNCKAMINTQDSLTDNHFLEGLVNEWKTKNKNKEEIEILIKMKGVDHKKKERMAGKDEYDDYFDDMFDISIKESDQVMTDSGYDCPKNDDMDLPDMVVTSWEELDNCMKLDLQKEHTNLKEFVFQKENDNQKEIVHQKENDNKTYQKIKTDKNLRQRDNMVRAGSRSSHRTERSKQSNVYKEQKCTVKKRTSGESERSAGSRCSYDPLEERRNDTHKRSDRTPNVHESRSSDHRPRDTHMPTNMSKNATSDRSRRVVNERTERERRRDHKSPAARSRSRVSARRDRMRRDEGDYRRRDDCHDTKRSAMSRLGYTDQNRDSSKRPKMKQLSDATNKNFREYPNKHKSRYD